MSAIELLYNPWFLSRDLIILLTNPLKHEKTVYIGNKQLDNFGIINAAKSCRFHPYVYLTNPNVFEAR